MEAPAKPISHLSVFYKEKILNNASYHGLCIEGQSPFVIHTNCSGTFSSCCCCLLQHSGPLVPRSSWRWEHLSFLLQPGAHAVPSSPSGWGPATCQPLILLTRAKCGDVGWEKAVVCPRQLPSRRRAEGTGCGCQNLAKSTRLSPARSALQSRGGIYMEISRFVSLRAWKKCLNNIPQTLQLSGTL